MDEHLEKQPSCPLQSSAPAVHIFFWVFPINRNAKRNKHTTEEREERKAGERQRQPERDRKFRVARKGAKKKTKILTPSNKSAASRVSISKEMFSSATCLRTHTRTHTHTPDVLYFLLRREKERKRHKKADPLWVDVKDDGGLPVS